MANGVYYQVLDIELNLTEDDLGHPEYPGLWELLRADKRSVPERQLQCIQCRHARPDCPEWMYLNERDGSRFATHWNPSIGEHSTNEGDQHKAFKERIARAAQQGGHVVELEDRSDSGRRRTDVLVKGANGLAIGWEVQLSYASLESVRKRAAVARQDGITPLWASVDSTRDFIDRVPWALLPDLPAYVIEKMNGLQVRGGVRSLEFFRCERGHTIGTAFCPVKGRGYCGKLHGTWQSAHGVHLDDLVRESAAGEYVPIIIPGRRTRRWWVRPADRERYADSVGGLPTEDNISAVRTPKPEAHQHPQLLETECRYGQDSGFRSPPALIRDDGTPVATPMTLTEMPPVPPSRPVIRQHVCGALADRDVPTVHCGDEARLYPCGWRCDLHRPGSR